MNDTSKDKFSAVWVSHSSMADFLRCPELYYLRNVYKDPTTGHKITRMEPPLALGQIVHDVVEGLSVLPAEDRLKVSLLEKFDSQWEKVSGKKGGFRTKEEEERSKEEGREMLKRVMDHPGPITRKAIKIKQELPHYWISEEENIILCGKIDWLEYLPESDSVHVVDFKTGRLDEKKDSLQLPIYQLLVTNTQSRNLTKASYWYLRRSDEPQEVSLPDINDGREKVLALAKRVKLARQLERFVCPQGGCKYCIPLKQIKAGKGELVGVSDYNQDIYII